MPHLIPYKKSVTWLWDVVDGLIFFWKAPSSSRYVFRLQSPVGIINAKLMFKKTNKITKNKPLTSILNLFDV